MHMKYHNYAKTITGRICWIDFLLIVLGEITVECNHFTKEKLVLSIRYGLWREKKKKKVVCASDLIVL